MEERKGNNRGRGMKSLGWSQLSIGILKASFKLGDQFNTSLGHYFATLFLTSHLDLLCQVYRHGVISERDERASCIRKVTTMNKLIVAE